MLPQIPMHDSTRVTNLRDGSMSICLRLCSSALDSNPEATRQRRETVEHPFGTMKARMGATHFLTKTLPKVAAELSVLAYNLTRVTNIVGITPLWLRSWPETETALALRTDLS
jgi:hypothetical protein